MVRLICRGSKTKITTEWAGGPAVTQRVTALENGADLGEFSTVAKARAHAETLLARNRSAEYFVCHDNGSVTDWVYDLNEQIRIDYRRGWINALFTAPILALITAGAIALRGVPAFSTHGLLIVAISVGFYLFMRASQNAVEGLVAWLMVFTPFMISLPRLGAAIWGRFP